MVFDRPDRPEMRFRAAKIKVCYRTVAKNGPSKWTVRLSGWRWKASNLTKNGRARHNCSRLRPDRAKGW
jgi:hypothetical protein